MLQFLSTKIEINFENRVDFVNFNKKINLLDKKLQNVIINMQNQKHQIRQKKLYWKKCQFLFEKFNKWQKVQTHKIIVKIKNDAFLIANRLNYFNCVHRLNVPRDWFAFSLFFHVSLRSPQGRTTFQNIITLCMNNFSVIYRSSLKLKNDRCSVTKYARKMKKYIVCFFYFRFDCLNWL